MEGWVKIHRQVIDNGWLRNPVLWAFWSYCLLKATHKPTTVTVGFQRVNLEPGQFIFGRKQAASDLGLSERQVRTCLNTLISTNNMTIKTTNKFSVISIVNWHTYQDSEPATDQQNDQQNDQQPTSNRPATDQQPTTYKNVKNEKNEKKKNPPISPKGDEVGTHSGKVEVSGVMMTAEQAELFSEFWQTYPKERRTGKGAVVKAWMKIGVDALLSARMVQALEKLKLTEQWNREGGKFIPMPTTWLNQRRWEDDIPEAPGGNGSWKTGIFAGVI